MSSLFQIDLDFLRALNSLSGVWAVDRAVNFLSCSNLVKGMLFMTVYCYFWFEPRKAEAGPRRIALIDGVFAGILAILAARLFANLLPLRLRPLFDPSSGFSIGVQPLPGSYENWSSMPSDHAALVFALSVAMLRVSRPVGWSLLSYSAFAICLPRVYLGIHYPSDIVVGALIGFVAARALPWIGLSRASAALVRLSARAPGLFYPVAFLATAEIAQMFDNMRQAGRALGKLVASLNSAQMAQTAVVLFCLAMIAGAAASIVMHFRTVPRTRKSRAAVGAG